MKYFVLGIALAALVSAAPAGNGKARRQNTADRVSAQSPTPSGVVLGVNFYRIPQADVSILRGYYRGQSLPPGLEKKLKRGGSLPPGWRKKVQGLPIEVERQLGPLPAGYSRGILDGIFVVYRPGPGVLVDLLATF